ncbi:lactoylglutathione lyase family protein [Cylindrospermum stagnale PCC 7417]|uniref:Lactoylglutathione lyase family protein n=1 Tax=Cylindrospermum stagnale PCC 7417 TaxID=56107 RepID=K9X4X4_9NOST|nr:VOC family protein [Cylindrospermum stagnale]AFZ26707.1 lactoylglutathione lyase family protein [Cylindrospermum stagnale PCC 7417]
MKLGYTVIWVDDVVKTVEFYEKAFGLVRRAVQDPGKFISAEIEIGSTTLTFSSTSEAEALFPGGFRANDPAQPPALIQISLITPDVATAYMRAIGAGAKPLDAPKNQPGGKTLARVRDPNGVLVALVNK